MKDFSYVILCLPLLLFLSCTFQPASSYDIDVVMMDIETGNNLRGLAVVDSETIWISGTHGLFLQSVNGGISWKADSIEGASHLDFRSVYAFNSDTAFVVSAGTPARIYKTTDGGDSWKSTFSSDNSAIFFDAISFWNTQEGIVMGDPVGGKLFLLKTIDGGETWTRISPDSIPPGRVSEGGFAASGTCLVTLGNKFAWIGVGGDSARVYRTTDQAGSWRVHQTPIICGSQMKGIYSLSFKDALHGIAVGGEWNVEKPEKSRAYTTDGGLTWALGSGVDSYCSGSCFVKDDIYLACGQSGIDISTDGGQNWKNISDIHLYGIKFDDSGKVGYGSGPGGRVVKLQLLNN